MTIPALKGQVAALEDYQAKQEGVEVTGIEEEKATDSKLKEGEKSSDKDQGDDNSFFAFIRFIINLIKAGLDYARAYEDKSNELRGSKPSAEQAGNEMEELRKQVEQERQVLRDTRVSPLEAFLNTIKEQADRIINATKEEGALGFLKALGQNFFNAMTLKTPDWRQEAMDKRRDELAAESSAPKYEEVKRDQVSDKAETKKAANSEVEPAAKEEKLPNKGGMEAALEEAKGVSFEGLGEETDVDADEIDGPGHNIPSEERKGGARTGR